MTPLNATHVSIMINTGTAHTTSMECGAVTQYVALCVRPGSCAHRGNPGGKGMN